MTATEAIKKLADGNIRFVSGKTTAKDAGEDRIRELSDSAPSPFAVVVCCADSRVPPELVFDQGLGALFVVRTAGNVIDDVGLGSVEYGAQRFGIPLVVVLGHEKCYAVREAVNAARADAHPQSCSCGELHGSIKAVTDRIRQSLGASAAESDYDHCEDENIRATVAEIKGSAFISELMTSSGVRVVGAKYGIANGKVTFWE